VSEEKGKKTVERISGRTWCKDNGLERAYNEATGPEQLELEAGLRAERDRDDVTRRRDKAQWLVADYEKELAELKRRIETKDKIVEALRGRQAVLEEGPGS
jgi:hypothetical protein